MEVRFPSAMERREKTEFLLEQMRLTVPSLLAEGKDAENLKMKKGYLSRGEADRIKVRVGGRKVNKSFLKEKGNEVFSVVLPPFAVAHSIQDLKLKYYDLMIQYALRLHNREYLDAEKHYHKIWETPSVNLKVDTTGKGREADRMNRTNFVWCR